MFVPSLIGLLNQMQSKMKIRHELGRHSCTLSSVSVRFSADQQGAARGFSTSQKKLRNGLDLPLLQLSLVRPHQSSRIAARVDRNVVHPSNIAISRQI